MTPLHIHRSATPTRDCQRVLPMARADIAWSLDLHRAKHPPQPGIVRRLFANLGVR